MWWIWARYRLYLYKNVINRLIVQWNKIEDPKESTHNYSHMIYLRVSFAIIKHHDQHRRKRLFHFTALVHHRGKSGQEIKAAAYGQKLKQRPWRCSLLAFSVCFCTAPRVTSPRLAPSAVSWALPLNHQPRIWTTGFPRDQSGGGSWSLFFQDDPCLCPVEIKLARAWYLMKMLKTHIGDKTVFSTSGELKQQDAHVRKNEIRPLSLNLHKN